MRWTATIGTPRPTNGREVGGERLCGEAFQPLHGSLRIDRRDRRMVRQQRVDVPMRPFGAGGAQVARDPGLQAAHRRADVGIPTGLEAGLVALAESDAPATREMDQ